MRRVTFDLDVLRSFATGVELGSFAKAADRLGRSTSALSAQLKKLEQQAGTPVLRRQGRTMVLTEAGETLLGYARRLLELNDEASDAVKGVELSGCVRLGLQEDFGESLLPDVLGRFARAHPRLRVEVRIARNAQLHAGIGAGQLDLALAWEDRAVDAVHARRLGELPLCWIGPTAGTVAWNRNAEPLPLVMLEAPCLLRTMALQALDKARISWRIAFTSASLAGIWAAVAAGLGLGLRTPAGLPAAVQPIDATALGLPRMGRLGLRLLRAEDAPVEAVDRLARILTERLHELPQMHATPSSRTRFKPAAARRRR